MNIQRLHELRAVGLHCFHTDAQPPHEVLSEVEDRPVRVDQEDVVLAVARRLEAVFGEWPRPML